jgi:tetratricopeptide (TPR) repeat protein
MIRWYIGAVLAVSFLFISCKTNHHPETKTARPNNLELRMAGVSAVQQSPRLLLSSEFKKISLQTAVLTNDSVCSNVTAFHVIDSMATALSSRLFMETDPYLIVKELNDCYFKKMGIIIENKNSTMQNTIPNLVFQSKRGSVVGGVMLMLLVAEEADIPLFAMVIRDHFFVRFDNGKIHLNIELLQTGAMLPDSWYTSKYAQADDSSATFKKLSNNELVGVLRYELGNAANHLNLNNAALINYAYALEYYKNFTDCQTQLDYLIDREKDTGKMLSALIQLRIEYQDLNALDRSLALLYLRDKNYKSAADYYARALEKNPDDIALLNGAAIACVNLHDFSSAKKYLLKVTANEPGNSQALALLAQCP